MKDSFLDNLRKKDKKRRQVIALATSSVVTLFIFAGWFVMVWNNTYLKSNNIISDNKQSVASPLSSFKASLDKIMESGFEQYQGFKKKFELEFESEFFTEVVDFSNEEYNGAEVLEKEAVSSSSREFSNEQTKDFVGNENQYIFE